jgi:AAA domain/Bifunctional DNA primase/polymerase, N-terminal
MTSASGIAHQANGDGDGKALRRAALLAVEAGIEILPPNGAGLKSPVALYRDPETGASTWKRPADVPRPGDVQIREWYGLREGLGFCTGSISGGLECLEFDDAEVYDRFRAVAIASGLADLVDRIEAGYCERTPGGGVHWLYYASEVRGNTKLASRATPTPDSPHKCKTLIETRGEGGYVVVAPSGGAVHQTGRPYILVGGGPDRVATIGDAERDQLWALARTFDETPRRDSMPRPEPTPVQPGVVEPGADYAARHSWADVLAGWTLVYTHGDESFWRRPDKAGGISATTNYRGSGVLKVFTTSTALDTEVTYTKFGAYTRLRHDGDYAAATRALSNAGYGTFAALAWDEEAGEWRRILHPNPCPKGGLIRVEVPGEPMPPPPRGSIHARKGRDHRSTNGAVRGREPGDDDPWDGEDPDAWLPPDEEVLSVRMSEVGRREVRWLFPDRIPIGKVTLIAGDPGLGKSFLTIDLIARVTTGGTVPAGGGECVPQGPVVLLSAEDDLADTVGPRLDAAGADAGLVHVLTTLVMPGGRREPFSLAYMPHLERVIVRAGRPMLVVIDPVTAYIGAADDHKNASLRAVLGPLSEMAARREVAVVIVTHLNKSSGSKALSRITGSLAYVALARVAWLVARDPDDPERRLFLSIKNNLAPEPPGLSYRIDRATTRIAWGDGPVTMTANEALRANEDQDKSRDRDGAAPRLGRAEEARAFLVEALADGKEFSHDELITMAAARGIAKNAIFEARGPAGVRARKVGFQGRWVWSIPVHAPNENV